MEVSAIGAVMPKVGVLNFEGTGVKRARREEAARARVNESIQSEGPVVKVPLNTLKALYLAAALSTASLGVPSAVYAEEPVVAVNPAVIIKPGEKSVTERLPHNEWIRFEADDGSITSLRVLNNGRNYLRRSDYHNDPAMFDTIEAEIVSGDEYIFGEIIAFHPDGKTFIIKAADGTRYTINAVSYEDTIKALAYLNMLNNDPHDRTAVYNQKY